MTKILSKREIRKRQTKEKHKLERKLERDRKRDLKVLWNKTRREVLERDEYRCLICCKDLKQGNSHNIQCHHILDKKNYPELKFDKQNLIILCYRDHKVGPKSPHLNSFAFMELFKEKRPTQYNYLKKWLENQENEGLLKTSCEVRINSK